MSSIDPENLKQALASEEAVVFAYLFGSHATGEVTPLSDVDIAIYPSRKLHLNDRLEAQPETPFSPNSGLVSYCSVV